MTNLCIDLQWTPFTESVKIFIYETWILSNCQSDQIVCFARLSVMCKSGHLLFTLWTILFIATFKLCHNSNRTVAIKTTSGP